MLIECVPNVSEGRRSEVVAAMADAIRTVPGVHLLDHSSDASHNRSVFTLVGDAAGVERAVLALFERALADIDLRAHRGEHPRLGAVDVVPFIPIEGATMADCVALARKLGAEVASRFDVPVYLYEDASTNPARKNLEDIRRGEFEGLAAKMASPEWTPDFGPKVPHPSAGASEVSMNLTNYEKTPIFRVFETVKREAERHGVSILESEIVGLVPSAALNAAAEFYLQIAGFKPDQVLENRLKS